VAYVGPGYLQMMRTALLGGREFDEHDVDGVQRVCIVDRTFAERYWPGEAAVGKRVKASGAWHLVVGVARDSKHQRFSEGTEPLVYLPLLQSDRGGLTIHVRTAGDPQRLLPSVEKTVHALDPRVPVYHVTTLEQSTRLGTMFERIAGTFVGTFGIVALALAAVGMYGVLAYSTRQRTREMGIRLALGARPAQVFALVLRQASVLVALGLGAGLLAAVATTRFVRTLLVGVGETDPVTFVAVGGVLTLVALVACAVPAWRAAHVQPLQALRHE
jgi:predicted permease